MNQVIEHKRLSKTLLLGAFCAVRSLVQATPLNAIAIEDMEEIPRELWPDLSDPNLNLMPLTASSGIDLDHPMREFDPDTSYQVPKDDPNYSPVIINGQTYAEYTQKQSTQRRLETVQTALSNECKTCIDDNNRWCPISNYASGYCCSGGDVTSCPAQGLCSHELEIPELQYMLCPNEAGCSYSRFLLPRTNGEEDLYEVLQGTFLLNDMCNFKVTNPSITDLNDVMYMKLEHVARAEAILIKGESLTNPLALYTMKIGQTYTALQGINFYILFVANDATSGQFVFRVWFKGVQGAGEEEPDRVTIVENPNDTGSNTETNTGETETDTGNSGETGTDTGTETNTDTSTGTTDTSNTGDNDPDSSTQETIGDVDPDSGSQEVIGDVDPDDGGQEVIGDVTDTSGSTGTETTDTEVNTEVIGDVDTGETDFTGETNENTESNTTTETTTTEDNGTTDTTSEGTDGGQTTTETDTTTDGTDTTENESESAFPAAYVSWLNANGYGQTQIDQLELYFLSAGSRFDDSYRLVLANQGYSDQLIEEFTVAFEEAGGTTYTDYGTGTSGSDGTSTGESGDGNDSETGNGVTETTDGGEDPVDTEVVNDQLDQLTLDGSSSTDGSGAQIIKPTNSFSQEYKEQLRSQGYTDEQIDELERSSFDAEETGGTNGGNNSGTVEDQSLNVTQEESDSGIDTGMIALVGVMGSLFIVPCLIWSVLQCVPKCCPNSNLGKKLRDWKEKRHTSAEQKKLMKNHKKNQKSVTNVTNASDDGMRDAIIQSGQKKQLQPLSHTNLNRIYPATDLDEGNASAANVGPGMSSENDFSDADFKKGIRPKPKEKSKIQIVGYDQNANPSVQQQDNANLRTMEINTDLDNESRRRQQFARTAANGFNSQTTMGSLAFNKPQSSSGQQQAPMPPSPSMMAMQMQQMQQMQNMQNMMQSQGTMTPEQMAFMMQQQQMMMSMMMSQTMAQQAPMVQSPMSAPQTHLGTPERHAIPAHIAQPVQTAPPQQNNLAVPNMFNPPNPNATGMNFNQTMSNMQQPSIGASLMDQEAVSLAPNLQGKKKKKKVKKKVNPNGFMNEEGRSSALANAGPEAQGHIVKQKDPQDNGPPLSELSIEDGNDQQDQESDWNYNGFDGAKVESASAQGGSTYNAGNNNVARKKFDINDLNGSDYSDEF